MRCPRCGSDNEFDVSKVPCSQCGLLVSMPERAGTRFFKQHTPFVPPTPQMPFAPHRSSQPLSTTEASHNITENVLTDSASRMRESYYTEPVQERRVATDTLQRKLLARDQKALVPSTMLLMPGTLLRNGRYRLQEHRERQIWLNGVQEATWIAQDAQRSGMQVMMCEVTIPNSNTIPVQAMLRTATMALASIGRHSSVPTLWDAFNDQGKSFFVFEPVDGESLQARLQRTGRALPEQQVIDMSLQILDILEVMSQQMPPLVHGLIRPEHIMISSATSDYILTNFSIVIAGRATQFVGSTSQVHSPYFSPELLQGEIDTRADLYALLATMYFIVTGSIPGRMAGEIPNAQRLNPTVSPGLNAILAKGLHTLVSNRFQKPVELRQALLALRQEDRSLSQSPMNGAKHTARPTQRVPQPTPIQALLSTQQAPAIPSSRDALYGEIGEQRQRFLSWDVQDFALQEERNTNRIAIALIIFLVLCLLIVLALWHFLL